MEDNLIAENTVYIPSTVEKKRAIAGLFFVGIMMMLALSKELSVYERYYLHLSVWLWSIGLMMFLWAVLVFFLLALLWYLYVLVLLAWFGLWVFGVQQARAWVYDHNFAAIRLLVWLWSWIISLFQDEDNAASPTQQ